MARQPQTTISRETGMALAMLAMWLFALLAPLHQTSGLMREMARIGQGPVVGWTFCLTGPEAAESDHALPLCPAQGIGKSELITPPAPQGALALDLRDAGRVLPPTFAGLAPGLATRGPQQPRAPPAPSAALHV
ncbi:hypothetical protein [Pseudogemmobacter sonorensis]|uniref:hypothetical protein n=1 Tax=Pseudogemmobacter sonorensis TaxID=2989681 RepID=UPI00368AD25F